MPSSAAETPVPRKPNPIARVAEESLVVQDLLSSRKHFEVLDGLRGVAAVAVMLYHTQTGGGLMPNGPLAVDLFFLLSGFVLGYSYDEKLHAGMSRLEFVKRRLVRLYPMIIVGAVGGTVVALIHNTTNPGEAYPLHSVLSSGALSLLMLPYLVPGVLGAWIFSFNPPLWSLSFELMANFIYVLVFKRLPIWLLVAVIVASVVWVGFIGPLGGSGKDNIISGIPRVIAGFFGGVLLFKLWRAGWLPALRGNFLVLAVGISALFLCPWIIGGWFYALAYVFFVIVIMTAAAARPSRFDKFYALSGRISYPLYLTHWLTLYVFTFIGMKLHLAGGKYVVVAVAHTIAAPFMAYAISRFYETPVLLILRDRFLRPRASPLEALART